MIAIAEAGNILVEARKNRERIECLPESCRPLDELTAYQCQNELVANLLKHYGGHIVGYKIACTNKSAQELLKLDGPFYGQLLSAFVHNNPAKLTTDDFFMRVVEPEFAFEMAADLPAKTGNYTKEEVASAVGAVIPSIEIVDSRFGDWGKVGALSLTADNACNGAWIYGKPEKNWTKFDLANQEVNLFVNGELIRKGRGDAVMGHPLNVLKWLANMLSKHGKGLKAGDMISTGITTEVYLAQKGDNIRADFGPIGSIELSFI